MTSFITRILSEAKIDNYYSKFVGGKIVSEKVFNTFKDLDEPPYIYLPYLIKMFKAGFSIKILSNFLVALKKTKEVLSNKDINA